jgi:hypothetical protein
MNKFLQIILLICPLALFAQPGKNNDVVVTGGYTPKLVEAQKINEQPSISDTTVSRFPIKYELNSRRVTTVYEVDPIKAANVKGEPLTKLYRGYVKGGFGSYMTPYSEVFYNSIRSKKSSAGVHYKHLSSSGQINDVGYSGFSNNELNLFGKSFIKKTTLSGGIDYRRNVVHYYGFDEKIAYSQDPLTNPYWAYNLERDSIKQRYQLVNINASISDNFPVDSHATKFKVDLNYYNYSDKFKAQENAFKAAGDVSFYFKTYDFNVKGGLDIYKNQNAVGSSNMTIFNLRPQITFSQPKWRLKAALNMYATSDSSYGFKLIPEVDFDLHIYENIIILNAGTDSRLKRITYKTLTENNPWLISDILPVNTWSPFRLYAGLRGSVSSKMAFNVRASFTPSIENQVFFVNDISLGNLNKLTYVTDNASLFEVNGEVTWQLHEKIRFIAKADFLGYTPDNEKKAWHTPTLRMSYGGKYNLRDKIWINAALLTFNKQYYRDFIYGEEGVVQPITISRELKGIADMNLGVEYRYTKLLGMFVQLNNIFNVRYERFKNYPMQRFNVMAGVSYTF